MAVALELSGRLVTVPERLHEGSEQVPDIPEAEALAVIDVQQERDPAEEEDERAGLLDDSEGSKEVSSTGGGTDDAIHFKSLLREMEVQGFLAGPIAANLLTIGIMNIITLSFVGHFGTEELAGSALASSVVFMFGRLPLIGLSCALDTLASQGFGAGRIDSLAPLWQRTVAFLAVHCVGLTGVVLALPLLLAALGFDPRICGTVATFSRALLPTVWLDILNRPMNRILVAQKITKPQACVAAIVMLLHLAINYAFVTVFGWGFESVAWANSIAAANTCVLMAAYFVIFGKGYCIWGSGLTLQAFRDWGPYAKIAYPALFMECAESWCWGSMTVLAGLLPNPASTVAALSIAFSLFTNMFFVYLSQSLACSTRVGNSLGAGDAKQARLAMAAARCWVPLTWLCSAFLFAEPHIRQGLVWLYTDGTDMVLIQHIHRLLWLLIFLNAADGLQCVMAGVIQGLGRQSIGLRVNLVAFYVVAIPAAYLFGFVLHWGVEGLYCGLILGATVQAACFTVFVSRLDWREEAQKAVDRVKAVATAVPLAAEP